MTFGLTERKDLRTGTVDDVLVSDLKRNSREKATVQEYRQCSLTESNCTRYRARPGARIAISLEAKYRRIFIISPGEYYAP